MTLIGALHRAIIGIMMMFRVVQDVDLSYQRLARLIVHGCCGGVTSLNFALANYEDCDVLLEVHFTITIILCSIVSFFASSCSCDFCH